MKYYTARGGIRDGDLIAFKGRAGLLEALICWITRSPYWHVGIAFWIEVAGRRRLMLVEAHRAGRRIVNLSHYDRVELEVFDVGLDWRRWAFYALDQVGSVGYGWLDFLVIGLRERFSWNVGHDFEGEVCSEFVGKLLHRAGINAPRRASPGRLLSRLRDAQVLVNRFPEG